jgi:CRP-like cAMP-binding protein
MGIAQAGRRALWIDEKFLDQSFSMEGLAADLKAGLIDLARPVKLKPGQVLFVAGDPGDGCYAVIEGSLKVSILSGEGGEQLLSVMGPGSIVGELSLFDSRPRSATVSALKPARLAFIQKHSFERFADDHPALYRHMLEIVGGRLRQANDVLAARSFLPLPGRVAQSLLQLADSFGKDVEPDRTLIHYKLSQADLANMAGGARENVSRVLNQWKRGGIISRISGYYCIEDKNALKAFSEL